MTVPALPHPTPCGAESLSFHIRRAPPDAMAFIKEFLSDFIKRTLMEDPLERREWRNKHIADVSAKAAELCVPRAGQARACALSHGLCRARLGVRCVAAAARGAAVERGAAADAGFDAAPGLSRRSKASWALPSKVPGFWREDANNAGVRLPAAPRRAGWPHRAAPRRANPTAPRLGPLTAADAAARRAQYLLNLTPSLPRAPGRRDPY